MVNYLRNNRIILGLSKANEVKLCASAMCIDHEGGVQSSHNKQITLDIIKNYNVYLNLKAESDLSAIQ